MDVRSIIYKLASVWLYRTKKKKKLYEAIRITPVALQTRRSNKNQSSKLAGTHLLKNATPSNNLRLQTKHLADGPSEKSNKDSSPEEKHSNRLVFPISTVTKLTRRKNRMRKRHDQKNTTVSWVASNHTKPTIPHLPPPPYTYAWQGHLNQNRKENSTFQNIEGHLIARNVKLSIQKINEKIGNSFQGKKLSL